VRARDPSQYGSLLLAFIRSPSAPGGLQLYGWTAIDAQNKRTTVKLSDVRYNIAVPDSAFTYAEPKKRQQK
jgi:outer membrane lipoprotein-sorting protein